MCGQVKLHWHHRNIAFFKSPFIGVFAFVWIDEFSSKPIVVSAHGALAFVKFFNPVGIGLSTNSEAFNVFFSKVGEIDIQDDSFFKALLLNSV